MTSIELPTSSALRDATPSEFLAHVQELTHSSVTTWEELDLIERAIVRRLPGLAIGRALPLDMVTEIRSIDDVRLLCRQLQADGSGSLRPSGPLRTGYISLREWRSTDMERLHAAAIGPSTGVHWRFGGATPSAEDFSRSFGRDTLATHVVSLVETDIAVGSVSCYSPSFENGWAYVAFQRSNLEGGAELMFEGLAAFISWVFQTWPFRMIYAEIGSPLFRSMPSLQHYFTDHLGTLPGHVYRDGAYHDVEIIVFRRERWVAAQHWLHPLLAA